MPLTVRIAPSRSFEVGNTFILDGDLIGRIAALCNTVPYGQGPGQDFPDGSGAPKLLITTEPGMTPRSTFTLTWTGPGVEREY